jgi:hypothetical protein
MTSIQQSQQSQQVQQTSPQQGPSQTTAAPHIPASELVNEQAQKQMKEFEEAANACKGSVTVLRQELTTVQEDLKKARDRGEALGPYYTQLQYVQNQIDEKERELKILQTKTGQVNVKPDLTQRQVNIGGGAVSRNEDIAHTSIVNSNS